VRVIACLLLLCSCGYHLGDSSSLRCSYEGICVPIACGDSEGYLTEALTQELSRDGWDVCSSNLVLHVSLCDDYRRNIGYQYDFDEEGVRTSRVVPNEGRLIVKANVSVSDGDCVVLGPTCIESYVDYDFNPLSTDTSLAVTSIGQFNNIDEAEETARVPLYHHLARKIVDYLDSSW
jgi:outer membrane lipopolysaccharide assembly protein LptE/RlpB